MFFMVRKKGKDRGIQWSLNRIVVLADAEAGLAAGLTRSGARV
jgi:hypothetical protein